ncbi:MAG: PrsW family intramembrane metalloprotease [Oscillospiraceae bacterium]|nr:PrsW family intramembrane metalloprotease [Oscillospiraceae bacterium]
MRTTEQLTEELHRRMKARGRRKALRRTCALGAPAAAACLAAPLLLAILCLRRGARRNMIFLLADMTACLFSAYVSAYAAGLSGADVTAASHEIAPAVEEAVKFLPLLFYLMVFEPEKKSAVNGALLVSVGFATFENVCFLTSYGTSDLPRLLIRGFGTGAMHVVGGMVVATGLFFLQERSSLRAMETFAMLCFVTTFHAVFNVLVAQTGAVFWIGAAFPLTLLLAWLAFFRRRIDLS